MELFVVAITWEGILAGPREVAEVQSRFAHNLTLFNLCFRGTKNTCLINAHFQQTKYPTCKSVSCNLGNYCRDKIFSLPLIMDKRQLFITR